MDLTKLSLEFNLANLFRFIDSQALSRNRFKLYQIMKISLLNWTEEVFTLFRGNFLVNLHLNWGFVYFLIFSVSLF